MRATSTLVFSSSPIAFKSSSLSTNSKYKIIEEIDTLRSKKPYKIEFRRNCDACVMKKIKCDGRKSCDFCTRKGLQCVFSAKRKPGPRGNALYFSSPPCSPKIDEEKSENMICSMETKEMDVSLHDSSVSVSMQSASPLSETRSDQGSKLESNGKMESVATPASEMLSGGNRYSIPMHWFPSASDGCIFNINFSSDGKHSDSDKNLQSNFSSPVLDRVSKCKNTADASLSYSWDSTQQYLEQNVHQLEEQIRQHELKVMHERVHKTFVYPSESNNTALLKAYNSSIASIQTECIDESSNVLAGMYNDELFAQPNFGNRNPEALRKSTLFGTFQASDLCKADRNSSEGGIRCFNKFTENEFFEAEDMLQIAAELGDDLKPEGTLQFSTYEITEIFNIDKASKPLHPNYALDIDYMFSIENWL